ncbi:polysaccharide pyruvyl transferase family protein [Bacteroides reticulotermitis]|uniref:polysaccharide pyruvyl transferase family protein n=1 Tax=Bacteroides reticulotermitis TaxID=1133319 RepID=UPI003A87A0F4
MTNKKLALVTCYFQLNYGSQLQAYATQLLFDKMKVENETICIDGLQSEINKAKYRYFLSRIWDINTVKDKWATIKKVIAIYTKGNEYRDSIALRKEKFKNFSQTKFHISKIYNSKQELANVAHQYAAFIVGSDQLWLPSNIEADYYTLNFVPDNVSKIALATSFGISRFPKQQAQKAARFLERLDFCSVRELSGQKIVKELTGRNIPIVCDPTILFTAEEWSCITKMERFVNEPYLFCYFLGNNPEQREFVKRFKQVTGYKIVQLQHCDEYIKSDVGFPDYAPYNVGPAEFVQLIRDAEYVFTDSFHASVFSLLYGKRFFTFRRYNNDSIVSTNGRLYSLLSMVGLEERLLMANEDVKLCLSMSIDYKNVHARLASLREFTKQYIRESLSQSDITYDNY